MNSKRRRKRKIKIIPLLFLLLILGGIAYFSYNKFYVNKNEKYDSDAMSIIKQSSHSKEILDSDYNKSLDLFLKSGFYNDSFYSEYLNINFKDNKNFAETVNNLLSKGYSVDEINEIFIKLSDENIIKLKDNSHLNLAKYLNIKNFDVNNFTRYEESMNSNLPVEKIVTYINIGLDRPFYSNPKTIGNADDITLLVNKYNKLPDGFEPKDLIPLSYDSKFMLRKEAAQNFEKMIADAKSLNHFIVPFSAYRSYSVQEGLYTRYVANDGVKNADTYSARPGYSEHQTGLAVDVRSTNLGSRLNDTDYTWVEENSYKYGFIIRYPQNSINITGYTYEDWHLRYIGIKDATKLSELKITYDEYYELFLK